MGVRARMGAGRGGRGGAGAAGQCAGQARTLGVQGPLYTGTSAALR